MGAWIAMAATFAFIGTTHQCVVGLWTQLGAMSFFNAHSDLLREEDLRRKREVPWWRPLERRRRKKQMLKLAFSVLTPAEQSQARDYDRSTFGWAMLVVATLILAITSWMSALSGAA